VYRNRCPVNLLRSKVVVGASIEHDKGDIGARGERRRMVSIVMMRGLERMAAEQDQASRVR
jgi:hypothetical protein